MNTEQVWSQYRSGIKVFLHSRVADAAEIGVSYSTLKSRVQKGRSELRHLFDGCCDFKLDSSGNLVDYDPKGRSCRSC